MFEYFYNEIFRSVIIGFGSLFNGIQIKHKDENDDTQSIIKVPLAYGPTQKFLARLKQNPDLNHPVQMTLPRMSFEFTNLAYDPSRKSTQTQQFVVTSADGTEERKSYLPVPYNMTITLSVYTKLNDDMLQIVEQIVPYFQPGYTLPIKFLGNFKEVMNVPVVLDNIDMTDEYEGNFDTRRALLYTFTFTAKTYVFGPLKDVSNDIIKKVTVGYIAGSKSNKYERDVTYQVTPRAIKDYDGVVATLLAENVDMNETVIDVENGSAIPEGSYIYIDQEEMYVETVADNKLVVRRAEDKSPLQNHVLGSKVYTINNNDNVQIELGDDFGFDGNVF
ncbi:tail completion protein [Synechococcus phage S-B43]|jgi:hypothetical protein|nr:tail completion protein [Synechococcus phage S-B43]QCW22869.1 tail completion protein [Synechococcus phage S-B05]QDH50489.1 tail completion protein [Synechococcus phage S-B43]